MSELTNIRNAEQRCLDNTPENFQGNESFELGEIAVETLDEILELLNQVYWLMIKCSIAIYEKFAYVLRSYYSASLIEARVQGRSPC